MTSPQLERFREAARLNNGAASEAKMGNGAFASTLLRHAMEIIGDINQARPSLEPAIMIGTRVQISRNVSTVPLEFSKVQSFCVYNKLLTFDPSPATVGSAGNPETELTFFSAAIIFNMGLIFHQRAAAVGSLKFYKAANRMYEKALNIIQMVPTFMDADMDALHLTVLNNRAHIGFQIGTLRETQDNLELVRHLSTALLSSESFMPHMEKSMIGEMLINSIVSAPECAACA